MVKEGRFREDLFYRLNVFPIRLPALRERVDDIPLLVWSFVREFGRTMGRKIDSIPRETMEMLKRYSWPGNIRELRNVIERAMIVSQGPTLQVELPSLTGTWTLAPAPASSSGGAAATNGMTLDDTRSNAKSWPCSSRPAGESAARTERPQILGLKPTTLESRMAKLGIKRER